MMPALIASSSPWRSGETLLSKSWNGAMPTPSFSSVPMNGVVSKSPWPAFSDRLLDADVDGLEDRGQQELTDGRVGLEHVGVDAEQRDVLARVADDGRCALVDLATDRQQHVGALVDEALCGIDRLLAGDERAREESVLLRAVPAEHA